MMIVNSFLKKNCCFRKQCVFICSFTGNVLLLPSWVLLNCCCCSIAKLCLILRPQGLQHKRPPCPSLSPGVRSDSCPLCPQCYLTISSSVISFSFCLQTFPTTGSFPMSQLFASGGQSIGDSASVSVLPMNVQGWFPSVNPKGNQP